MRGKTCVRGVVVLGVAFGGYIAPASMTSDVLGVSVARAEKFYTRKRVNGQWITGLFPSEGAAAPARTRRRPRVVAHVRATPPRPAAQVAPATPPEAPDRTATASVEGFADPTSTESVVANAAGPDLAAPPFVTAAAAPDTNPAPTALEVLPSSDERLARLRKALLARAQEIAATAPATVPAAFASANVTAPAQPGPDTRVVASPPETRPAEPAKIAARLEPRSVSYDFETGVKTTVFANSVVREPFDVPAVKRLALPAR